MNDAIGLSNVVLWGLLVSFGSGCATTTVDDTATTRTSDATLTQRETTCHLRQKHVKRPPKRHTHGVRNDPSTLKVLTFNAALAPGFEPLATERTEAVISALTEASLDTDVMCVQEFWQAEAFDALTENLTELPYTLRMTPKPGTGGCSESELYPLFGCLESNCAEATGDQVVGCAVTACPNDVAALSGGCLGCVMNHLDDLGSCLAEPTVPSDPAIFGGAYDIGFMSRWPIQRTHQRELTSYFVRASVLHARIVVPKLGPVDAFCTHLGSDLGIVSYAGAYDSWEGEHEQQVQELVAFINEVSLHERPILLLGDLNMGPAVGINEAVLADDYALLTDAGFDNVHATEPNALCTNCPDTSFRDADASAELIDHILSVRLPRKQASSERLFVDPVPLGDELPPFHLSDHFALKVTFDLNR